MATYLFDCKKCKNVFEVHCSIHEFDKKCKKPKCPNCKSIKTTQKWDKKYTAKSFMPKTLGYLADKNTDKYSEDYKDHLYKVNNAYKEQKNWTTDETGKPVLREEVKNEN